MIVNPPGGLRGDPSCPLDPSGGADRSGRRLRDLSLADHAQMDESETRTDQSRGNASPAIPPPTREQVSFTRQQRRVNRTTNHGLELQLHSYPASEQRISEVERGRICNAILPMPDARTLSAGDSVVFALAYSHAGKETCYVKCGDSVCVSLTEVTDLGAIDPATGRALFRLSWKPLGQEPLLWNQGARGRRHARLVPQSPWLLSGQRRLAKTAGST